MDQDEVLKEIEIDLRRSLRVWAIVYFHFAKQIIEKLGTEGEKTLRRGLRAYAKFRGERLKELHKKQGLPINLETARRYWDLGMSPKSGTVDLLPNTPIQHVRSKPTVDFGCPMYQVCKEGNFEHYGYIYCDEAHQEMFRAYNPNGVVEIHENIMKGDDFCGFDWLISEHQGNIDRSVYKALEELEAKDPVGFAKTYLKGNARAMGVLYYFLSDALIKRFDKEGQRLVESALVEIGHRRGRELKETLAKAGLDVTWKSIFDNFDLPYKYVWNMQVKASNNHFMADVDYCPLAELWNGLKNKQLGAMYCDIMYKAMFMELMGEESEIRVSSCMTKGAKKCKLELGA
ncbi:MAG: L-2-amino-thiazoline-4-carboxylic acid hydrolase [Candidatus Hodarchaeota archaeon]